MTHEKELYTAALADVYGNDQGMIDYCLRQAEVVAQINGYLLPIEKKAIEKRFCFGYSSCGQGPSFDMACAHAQEMRESAECFKAENLKDYRNAIKALESADAIALYTTYYKDTPIRRMQPMRWQDVLQAMHTFCAFLDDIKGTEVKENGVSMYILTDAERYELKKAYESAMKAHEKRIDAYLKRYGLTKIRVWTYWLDD